jgi:hypothetical protein
MSTEALEEAWGAVCALLDAGQEAEAIAKAKRLVAIDPVASGPLPAGWPRCEGWGAWLDKNRPRLAQALDRLIIARTRQDLTRSRS